MPSLGDSFLIYLTRYDKEGPETTILSFQKSWIRDEFSIFRQIQLFFGNVSAFRKVSFNSAMNISTFGFNPVMESDNEFASIIPELVTHFSILR